LNARDFAAKARDWADFSMQGDQLLVELTAAATERFTTPAAIGSGLEDANDAVAYFAAMEGLSRGILIDACRDTLERLRRTRHMHLSAVIPETLRKLSASDAPETYPEVALSAGKSFANAGSKVGGSPDFLQEPEVKTCPSCGRQMGFVAQIDSMPDVLNIVDNGMIYVFYCSHCFRASTAIQFH